MTNDVLQQLTEVIESRKGADPQSSYVAKLFSKGTDHILKKVGEEATETVIATKDGDSEQIIYESADLLFHMMVNLSNAGLSIDEVLNELARRFGVSGIDEKASRPK